ncbi:MAG: hypothetical protein PHO89_01705 [Methylacidiphilaceae bacterium]|nr:hypothetical protein [Candidatus Methylacidiphilaceae bacterium]
MEVRNVCFPSGNERVRLISMPAKGRFLILGIFLAVFTLWVDLSTAGAGEAGHARSSNGGSSAERGLWRTFPGGGGYFQQRPDGPIIRIPSPPRLPALAVPGKGAGQQGRIPQERVVPSFIPNEAMETGAFSGGL